MMNPDIGNMTQRSLLLDDPDSKTKSPLAERAVCSFGGHWSLRPRQPLRRFHFDAGVDLQREHSDDYGPAARL